MAGQMQPLPVVLAVPCAPYKFANNNSNAQISIQHKVYAFNLNATIWNQFCYFEESQNIYVVVDDGTRCSP